MPLQPTGLEYRDPLTPYSPLFDDVYFAAEQGIEESTYVYLEGTGLRERLSAPASSNSPPLQILEIGFGVGLNFLLTLREFEREAASDRRLIYFSVEKHPVFEKDLCELYSRFPALESQARLLLDQYPILTPGFHTLSFFDGRVKLILLLGEAEAMLSRLEARIDLWYWDGFAPSKNPDAFSEKLFQQVARLSAPGAVGSSFTSAGWVRRALSAVGFQVEKRVGYGKKRECLKAIFGGAATANREEILPAWFSAQKLKRLQHGDRIAVAGAGLAGSAIARALADRGFSVTVFDPNGIAQRASGNSAGLFNVQLSKLPNPISRFAQLSLAHLLRELKSRPEVFVRLGIFRAADGAEPSASDYPADFYEPAIRDSKEGWLFPRCGILNPQALCRARLDHPLIQFIAEAADSTRFHEFDHVVYATGADLQSFLASMPHADLEALPLRPVRGQALEVKATEASRAMTETWVQDGYISAIAPEVTGNEHHWIGATYQVKEIASDQEQRDTAKLIEDARERWSVFRSLQTSDVVNHRVGFRLSTPDKLPLIGPVCDREQLRSDYARAFRGSKSEVLPALSVRAGEWMLLGLGSRGISYSSLAAEILASLMVGDPLPVELDLWEHLHPARFWIRNLKRNELE